MDKQMLVFAIPQIEAMLAQARARVDIPEFVKKAAQDFLDALIRWRDNG